MTWGGGLGALMQIWAEPRVAEAREHAARKPRHKPDAHEGKPRSGRCLGEDVTRRAVGQKRTQDGRHELREAGQ